MLKWLSFLLVVASCGQPVYLVGVDTPDAAAGAEPDAAPPLPPAPPTRDTPVANCAAYPTLGAMSGFLERRCGVAVACHAQASPWTTLEGPDLFATLLDVRPKFDCMRSLLIDSVNPLDSLLYIKSAEAIPICPDGSSGMLQMPPQQLSPVQPLLTAEELVCLEQFVRAAARRPGSPVPSSLHASVTELDLGSTSVGTASGPQYVVVSLAPGAASSGKLITQISGDFTAVADDCAGRSLVSGQTCIVILEFRPTRTGARQGSLDVAARPGGSVSVPLRGLGR